MHCQDDDLSLHRIRRKPKRRTNDNRFVLIGRPKTRYSSMFRKYIHKNKVAQLRRDRATKKIQQLVLKNKHKLINKKESPKTSPMRSRTMSIDIVPSAPIKSLNTKYDTTAGLLDPAPDVVMSRNAAVDMQSSNFPTEIIDAFTPLCQGQSVNTTEAAIREFIENNTNVEPPLVQFHQYKNFDAFANRRRNKGRDKMEYDRKIERQFNSEYEGRSMEYLEDLGMDSLAQEYGKYNKKSLFAEYAERPMKSITKALGNVWGKVTQDIKEKLENEITKRHKRDN